MKARLRSVLRRAAELLRPNAWVASYPLLSPSEQLQMRRLTARLLEQTDHHVFGGPFADMKIPTTSPLTSYPMFVVGSYEEEIHDALNHVIACAPARVINIGSAEGLYTVGLAKSIETVEVVAFERDFDKHLAAATELAEVNGVRDRIVFRGSCSAEDLNELGCDDSFVLCDCEGGEVELLDPEAVPGLRSCFIVCETHEFHREGATRLLISRFLDTHVATILDERVRDPRRYRILRTLPPELREVAVCESRHIPSRPTWARFLILEPRAELSGIWSRRRWRSGSSSEDAGSVRHL